MKSSLRYNPWLNPKGCGGTFIRSFSGIVCKVMTQIAFQLKKWFSTVNTIMNWISNIIIPWPLGETKTVANISILLCGQWLTIDPRSYDQWMEGWPWNRESFSELNRHSTEVPTFPFLSLSWDVTARHKDSLPIFYLFGLFLLTGHLVYNFSICLPFQCCGWRLKDNKSQIGSQSRLPVQTRKWF